MKAFLYFISPTRVSVVMKDVLLADPHRCHELIMLSVLIWLDNYIAWVQVLLNCFPINSKLFKINKLFSYITAFLVSRTLLLWWAIWRYFLVISWRDWGSLRLLDYNSFDLCQIVRWSIGLMLIPSSALRLSVILSWSAILPHLIRVLLVVKTVILIFIFVWSIITP